jgi:GNAT superfamily N-acetyltransferase
MSTTVYSEVDLRYTDFARRAENSRIEGIQVVSLAELAEIDPDWKPKYVEACNASMHGMPSYTEVTPFTLDLLEKLLLAPGYAADLKFVAIQNEHEFIGVTGINPSPVNPKRFSTGATGVRPEYRRRGIAKMLKAHAIECVQRRGGSVIGTENEETNPMLELNYKLGFEHKFDIYSYLLRAYRAARQGLSPAFSPRFLDEILKFGEFLVAQRALLRVDQSCDDTPNRSLEESIHEF